MARIDLFPAVGATVYTEGGAPITSAGIEVTWSAYYENLVRRGLLLTTDPLGVNDPGDAEDLDTVQLTAVLCTDLTTRIGTGPYATIYTSGHTTHGDGGGGLFVWYSGDATAANNGTIFGNTASGRWKRVYSGAVNIRWFGAKGDGVTNDSTIVQTVINAFNEVYFPRGNYLIQTTYVPSNRLIFGDGMHATEFTLVDRALNTVYVTYPLAKYPMFTNSTNGVGNTNIHFRDFKMNLNSVGNLGGGNPWQQNYGMGISFHYVDYGSVERVWGDDATLDAFYIGRFGSFNGQTTGGPSSNIVIRDCLGTNSKRNGASITRATDCQILDSRWDNNNCGWNPLDVANTDAYRAGTIDVEPNNVIDVCHRIIVKGNVITDAHAAGIQIAGEANTCWSINVADNNITMHADASDQAAISLSTEAQETTIANNVLVGGSFGVRVAADSSWTSIVGNTINGLDLGAHGILVNNGAANTVISSNTIRGHATGVAPSGSGSGRVGELLIVGNRITTTTGTNEIQVRGGDSTTWDPPNIANGATTTTTISVDKAQVGDVIASLTSSVALAAGATLSAAVTSAATVTVTLTNGTGGDYNLGSTVIRVVINGRNDSRNVMCIGNLCGDQSLDSRITNYDANETMISKLSVGDQHTSFMTKMLHATAEWASPATSLATGSHATTNVTITGAVVGDVVSVGFSQAIPAGALLVGAVTAADTVTVTLLNQTGGNLTVATGNLTAAIMRYST